MRRHEYTNEPQINTQMLIITCHEVWRPSQTASAPWPDAPPSSEPHFNTANTSHLQTVLSFLPRDVNTAFTNMWQNQHVQLTFHPQSFGQSWGARWTNTQTSYNSRHRATQQKTLVLYKPFTYLLTNTCELSSESTDYEPS